jgi:hypothetical protein
MESLRLYARSISVFEGRLVIVSPCLKLVPWFSVTIADTDLEIHRKMDVDITPPSGNHPAHSPV